MSFAQFSSPLVYEDLPAKSSEIPRRKERSTGWKDVSKALEDLIVSLILLSRGPYVFTFPLAFTI